MKNKLLRSKNCLILCCFVFMCFAFSTLTHPGQKTREQEHEPIVEKVTVTNVEVPVRVLFKGKPVDNLTKEDFIVYENRQKMENMIF